jgi:hypothetical protein
MKLKEYIFFVMREESFNLEKMELYWKNIVDFAKFANKKTGQLGESDAINFIKYLKDDLNLKESEINSYIETLRFFSRYILHQKWKIKPKKSVDLKSYISKLKLFGNLKTRKLLEKYNKVLNDFGEAITTIQGIGFSINDLQVGMGLIPEMSAKVIGSLDKMDTETLKSLILKNKENKILYTLFNTLLKAYDLRNQIGGLGFKGIEIDLKIGLPPKASVKFRN